MSYPYTKAQKHTQFDNRVAIAKESPHVVDFEDCFNVRVDGVDVVLHVTRAYAQKHLDAYRECPVGFIQVYRADRPLEQRRPAWRKESLPRPWRFHVTASEYVKALAAVSADPEILCETEE